MADEKKREIKHGTKFPAGLPKPHAARDWGLSIESALASRGLTDIALKQIPAGRFDPLWSPEALEEPPPLPEHATFKDKMSHRSMMDEVRKRKAQNERILAQRADWWQQCFNIFTDTQSLVIFQQRLRINPSSRATQNSSTC